MPPSPTLRGLLRLVTLFAASIPFILAAPTDGELAVFSSPSKPPDAFGLLVPSAASFYVPRLPDLQQDPNHPLSIFAGHLSSDPSISRASSTDVTAHLYFVLVKNRRHADKERVMFWFNVRSLCVMVSFKRFSRLYRYREVLDARPSMV